MTNLQSEDKNVAVNLVQTPLIVHPLPRNWGKVKQTLLKRLLQNPLHDAHSEYNLSQSQLQLQSEKEERKLRFEQTKQR